MDMIHNHQASTVANLSQALIKLEQLEKEISGVLNNLTGMRMEGGLIRIFYENLNVCLLSGSDLIIEGDGRSEKFIAG